MYAIICLREKDGKDIPIPIEEPDDGGEPTGIMALWETFEEAKEFCGQHILCKSSRNIINDINTADGIFQ